MPLSHSFKKAAISLGFLPRDKQRTEALEHAFAAKRDYAGLIQPLDSLLDGLELYPDNRLMRQAITNIPVMAPTSWLATQVQKYILERIDEAPNGSLLPIQGVVLRNFTNSLYETLTQNMSGKTVFTYVRGFDEAIKTTALGELIDFCIKKPGKCLSSDRCETATTHAAAEAFLYLVQAHGKRLSETDRRLCQWMINGYGGECQSRVLRATLELTA